MNKNDGGLETMGPNLCTHLTSHSEKLHGCLIVHHSLLQSLSAGQGGSCGIVWVSEDTTKHGKS